MGKELFRSVGFRHSFFVILASTSVAILVATTIAASAATATLTPMAFPEAEGENCIPALLEFPRNASEYPCDEGPEGEAVVKWISQRPAVPDSGSVSLSVHEDIVIAESESETYALDVETGEILWVNDDLDSAPWDSWSDGQSLVQVIEYTASSYGDDGEPSDDGEISFRVLSMSTGETILSDSVSGCRNFCPEPLLLGGMLIVDIPVPETNLRSLEVYSVENGALLWERRAAADISGDAANYSIDNDHLYLIEAGEPGQPRSLLALDRTTGDSVWKTGLSIHGSENIDLVQGETSLYIVDPNASPTLLSFDAKTGESLWDASLEGAVDEFDSVVGFQGSSVIVRSSSVQGGEPTFLQAIDSERGDVLWVTEVWGDLVSVPREWMNYEFSDDFFLFVTDFDLGQEEIRAYDSDTGMESWRTNLDLQVPSILRYFVFDGRVYMSGVCNRSPGDLSSWALSLNANNGLDRQSLIEPDPSSCVLVASSAGAFCALTFASKITPTMEWAIPSPQYEADETGELREKWSDDGVLWRRALNSEASEPEEFFRYDEAFTSLEVADGVAYVAAVDGTVFAVAGDAGPHAIEPSDAVSLGGTPTLGDTALVTGGGTVLRAAPADSGVEIMPLEDGMLVEIIGGPINEGHGVWWQVREPESGNVGYVPAGVLLPQP